MKSSGTHKKFLYSKLEIKNYSAIRNDVNIKAKKHPLQFPKNLYLLIVVKVTLFSPTWGVERSNWQVAVKHSCQCLI